MSNQTPVYQTTFLDFIRRHTALVMVVLTVVMVSMMFFGSFDPSSLRFGGGQTILKGYGKSWNESDLNREGTNSYQLAMQFPQTRLLLEILTSIPANSDPALQSSDWAQSINFLANRAILREETSKLGIEPSDKEVDDLLKQIFVNEENVFDPEIYRDFTTKRLGNYGMGEKDLKALFADLIRLQKLLWLKSSELETHPAISTAIAENMLSQIFIKTATLEDKNFEPKENPTAEKIEEFWKKTTPEIQLALNALIAQIKTGVALTQADQALINTWSPYIIPEERAITLVTLKPEKITPLAADSAKGQLPKETEEAYNAFAETWNAIEAAEGANWEKLIKDQLSSVKGAKLDIVKIPAFSLQNPPANLAEKADSKSGNTLTLAQSAFSKTVDNQDALSKLTPLVILENGSICLIHIDKIELPKLKTQEQAKAEIIAAIKVQETRNAIKTASDKLYAALEKGKAEGKSFDEIAKAEGATIASFGPLGRNVKTQPEGLESPMAVLGACSTLNPGQISKPIRSATGTVVAELVKREIIDTPETGQIVEYFDLNQKQQIQGEFIREWFQQKGAEAEITVSLPTR